jgi:hypothetical protein
MRNANRPFGSEYVMNLKVVQHCPDRHNSCEMLDVTLIAIHRMLFAPSTGVSIRGSPISRRDRVMTRVSV